MVKNYSRWLAIVLTFLSSHAIAAETAELSTLISPGVYSQGWWGDSIAQQPGNFSFFTGYNQAYPPVLPALTARGYLTFDLSAIGKPVASASLKVHQNYCVSPDPVETFGVFDVSTPSAVLNSKGFIDPAIVADLGSGVQFAQVELFMNLGPPPALLVIDLNDSAVDAINASRGEDISFGFSLLSLRSNPTENEFVFGGPIDIPSYLTLSLVPEPSRLSLSCLVPACLAMSLRRAAMQKRLNLGAPKVRACIRGNANSLMIRNSARCSPAGSDPWRLRGS
jgi:hypothetical protein